VKLISAAPQCPSRRGRVCKCCRSIGDFASGMTTLARLAPTSCSAHSRVSRVTGEPRVLLPALRPRLFPFPVRWLAGPPVRPLAASAPGPGPWPRVRGPVRVPAFVPVRVPVSLSPHCFLRGERQERAPHPRSADNGDRRRQPAAQAGARSGRASQPAGGPEAPEGPEARRRWRGEGAENRRHTAPLPWGSADRSAFRGKLRVTGTDCCDQDSEDPTNELLG